MLTALECTNVRRTSQEVATETRDDVGVLSQATRVCTARRQVDCVAQTPGLVSQEGHGAEVLPQLGTVRRTVQQQDGRAARVHRGRHCSSEEDVGSHDLQ